MNPFRTIAKPGSDAPTKATPILRSAKCTVDAERGHLALKWDLGSDYVEIGVWSGDGSAIQFVRLHTKRAAEVVNLLGLAIEDASKKDGDK